MGCDIHYAVELRPLCLDCKEGIDQDICGCVIHDLVGSNWECYLTNAYKENEDPNEYANDSSYASYLRIYQSIWGDSKAEFLPNDWSERSKHPLYIGRNYYLFSIIGGVRNYGDLITPIGEGRGLPKDVSREFREWSDNDSDAHSTSFVTLSELMKYDCSDLRDILLGTTKTLNSLIEGLGKLGKPDDVRLSFFFDN